MLRGLSDVTVDGHRLEYEWSGPPPDEAATLVFLHEGLGCVSRWRDYPRRLAEHTGCGALVYSRLGHGRSDALERPRPVSFMHDEASIVLPALLEAFRIETPILVGHSDGASIALIHASAHPGEVTALVLEAPHVFVEDLAVTSIERMKARFETTDLRERLARHHGSNADRMFAAWNDIWLDPDFRSWNIQDALPRISCPILVIQGRQDEYGTLKQVETIAAEVAGPIESLILDCGHRPHVEETEAVIEATTRFIVEVLRRPPALASA